MKKFLPVSGKMSGTLVFTFFLFLNAYFGVAQTVTTDKLDYAPGETAIITGTGWSQDQFVDVHLHEEPVYEHDHDYHGIAVDATGNWEIQYPIEERHLGVTFTVEVIGLKSGATATTVFTDGVVFPSGINTSSQDQELCPGGTSNPLVASITTCEAGGGATSYRDISYTWYYNTTDSNVISGSTQTVLHTNTTAATTSTSYTPPTNYSGTRYYFSRVTFNPRTGQGGQCGQENAPGYPFTTGTIAVTVEDNEAPVFANVPADQLNIAMDAGACGATITWTDPTANDNCDGSVTVVRTDATGYNSGDLFAAGSYTISYSATDSEGNVQTASFAVSVNADAEDPVFADVPSDQLNVTMDAGACGATITWTDPTANDNCDGSVTVVRTDATGYNSGDLFAAGSYTISYSATDSEGNVQTASFAVNVNADAEKPVFANVPADQLNVTMDAGACGATITWTDPTANDNCDGSVTVVRTDATGYNSGDLFAAGSYTISYSATDSEGNVQTASFAVNVNADAEKPVFANVPADQLNVSMDEGACGATITWTDPTANDNCDGSVSVVRTDVTGYNSGDLFAEGSYTISYSATDSEGNVQTASFAVSVNADAEDPVFADVPADQLNVSMDEGACGATITWTDPTANDNCDGSVTVVRTDATGYNSGDLFAAGSYTISYSATDSEGNVQTASFAVNVNADAEKPVFANVPADQLNVSMDEGACGATITWTHPTANDNCDGSVTVVRTDATGYNSGDLFAAGSYTISYSATDSEGNVQTASFAVSVNADAEDPVFADVPSDQLNVTMDAGACGATITWTDPTANDNCDGSVTVVRTDATGYNSGDLFAAGSYTISYSATDSEGNVQTASFAVSVNADAEDPTIVDLPANIEVSSDAGICGAVVSWTAPPSADNCSGSSIARTAGPASGSVFSVGTTTITYKATDASGNTHSESFTVTVTNNAPGNIVITGPIEPQPLGTSIKMEASFTDENIASATWKAFDGSSVVQESVNPASGNYATHTFVNLPAGVYTIILKLEDHCGETGEEKFQYVTIYDPDGGFVTGGGWINSPVGAMPAKPATIGKANFGFVSKYKKGSNQVDGNTEFQFNAGDVNFKSTMHESGSLVISGKKATYRGTGTINGGSGYKFVVVAIDGNLNGATDPDRFRIKISTTTGTVIYDNQIGKDENTEDATVLGNNGQGGGSVVIHEVKKKQAETTEKIGATTNPVEPEIQILNSLEIAPNPMVYSTEIRFSLLKDSSAEIKIFDMNGRLVKNLYSGNVRANELVSLEFNRENLMSGIYICKLLTGDGRSYEKQIVIN